MSLESINDTNNKVVKTLYEEYAKKLFAYTRKNYTINEDDIWELVYKTIYKIANVNSKYTFDSEQKKAGFIFKTHINYLRNYFRDHKTFESQSIEIELHENFLSVEPETNPKQSIQLTVLQKELDKLEDWQRILLLMRGQDIEYSKIAEFIDKPENQLKVYYSRLKKQLHDNINYNYLIPRKMSNINNNHSVSDKELDNLLNEAFLNLDFNNPKNEKIMETISNQYLVNTEVTFANSIQKYVANKLFLSIGILSIMTTIVVFYFNSSYNTPINNSSEAVVKFPIENYKPKTEFSLTETNAIVQKRKHDSSILKLSVTTKKELMTTGDVKPVVVNNEVVTLTSKSSSPNEPVKSKLFFIDTSFVFPHLTEKEIKETHKQKKRMVNALATLQKSKYVVIPSGTFDYKAKKVSVQCFYISNVEVTNLEYRTFLFDLLINNRKEEFLKAKPNQSQWNQFFKGVTYNQYNDNYFSHPAYDDYPVVNITKEGAEMYCRWLTIEANNYLKNKNKPLLNDLRIPSITEWVYAAKGDKNTDYPWGFDKIQNDKNCFLANFDTKLTRDELNMNCPYIKFHNATTVVGLMLDGSSTTAPVYSFNPSLYGLFCMSGNVSEMVYLQDGNYNVTNEIKTKGGSWASDQNDCKISAIADFNEAHLGNPTVGFRPVISFN